MTFDLSSKHCEACEGIGNALTSEQIQPLMSQISSAWSVSKDHKEMSRSFRFKNFYETMAFVNALAWIATIENHHPDLKIGYDYCDVHFTTHALKGLSLNDFICAAKTEKLLES